ncbi:MAG: hypothetical protein VX278_01840, partial [Myxococcota bacterium]|nr:hypothetical protein [Myxococcota bacterium]
MRKRPTKIQTYDLIIALFAGLTFAVLSAWYISPALIASPTLSPYIAPNFGDYCEYLGLWDVQHIRQIKPDEIGSGVQAIDFMHPGRRTLIGSIPARLFLSKFGVIDSLTAGALLCSVIFGGSLYLWATALFGRLAGIFSVIAALSTGSLCLMTRHLTFYPTITAFFALAGAATTIAMRNQYRSGWPYLLAGIAIGGSLLVDVRGLIWVGMCIPFLGLSILWQRKFFPILRNVLLLGLPIWASFQIGSWNTGRLLPMSLEE